ncbi:hypothetical protein V8C37DRAFT_380614 [Trichoderma ceciliae]
MEIDEMKSEDVVMLKGLRRSERVDIGLLKKRWSVRVERPGLEFAVRLPGCSRNGRKHCNRIGGALGSSRSTVWTNASDPIHGDSLQSRPKKQQFTDRAEDCSFTRLPQLSRKGRSDRLLSSYRHSEPG